MMRADRRAMSPEFLRRTYIAGVLGVALVVPAVGCGPSDSSANRGNSGAGGDTGTSGESGASGVAGEGGDTGSAGASGEGGTAGDTGASGVSGHAGAAGNSGTAGMAGTAGTAGTGSNGPVDRTVTLRTYSNNYLVADMNGGAALMAYSTVPAAWETFTLTDLDGGPLLGGDIVTLKAGGGQWASATNGGGSSVNFTAAAVGADEKFILVKVSGDGAVASGDKVALKTTVSGQFLSAIDGGGSTVVASAAEIQEWETLTLSIADMGNDTDPDFGPNVLIFDPTMSMDAIQGQLDQVFSQQETNQFGDGRFTYLFKPGQYQVDAQIGFYTTALGLGTSPDDVTITGAVRAKADWFNGNATQNFWRGAENLAVVPTKDDSTMIWAVSQATTLRRIHVKGSIHLWDGGWSSGGFMADSKVDGQINSGTQQQFLTRNSALHQWQGNNWNMVFVGDDQAPANDWAGPGYTVVDKTPTVREKPYLIIDDFGKYSVKVPPVQSGTQGITWGAGTSSGAILPIQQFYLAHAGQDTSSTINAALASGKHLLLTPGVYHLDSSLKVTKPGTVILGLGLATLIPDQGNLAMEVDDIDGVSIAGVLFDAGEQASSTLLRIGAEAGSADHSQSPTALFDVSCRVGGATAGNAESCVTIHSNDVLIDNIWLWRADHGNGVGWDVNPCKNGLVVHGDNVSAYGLFVEHFEQYQTLWNGNGGRVYFYQSEIPYDVPSQDAWKHEGVNGYASYKVADGVTSHDARGLGVYSVFNNPVTLENAIETPIHDGVDMQHMITVFLGGTGGAQIHHIINGTGDAVSTGHMTSKSPN